MTIVIYSHQFPLLLQPDTRIPEIHVIEFTGDVNRFSHVTNPVIVFEVLIHHYTPLIHLFSYLVENFV